MNTHKTRVRKIRAIQFTGSNTVYISKFLDVPLDKISISPLSGTLHIRDAGRMDMIVQKTHWIVDNKLWLKPKTYYDVDFKSEFVPI